MYEAEEAETEHRIKCKYINMFQGFSSSGPFPGLLQRQVIMSYAWQTGVRLTGGDSQLVNEENQSFSRLFQNIVGTLHHPAPHITAIWHPFKVQYNEGVHPLIERGNGTCRHQHCHSCLGPGSSSSHSSCADFLCTLSRRHCTGWVSGRPSSTSSTLLCLKHPLSLHGKQNKLYQYAYP